MARPPPSLAPEDGRPLLDTGRSWSTRLAWATLVLGGILVATRLSVATVVPIHGDGMAPTLLDGDRVLLLRGTWSVDAADVVVYEPLPPPPSAPPAGTPPPDAPNADNADGRTYPDAREDPVREFRNVAVIDPEELEDNWQKVQRRSDGIMAHRSTPLRLGRVLARPGDRVAFHVPGAALGLAIEGTPLLRKEGESVRVFLVDSEDEGETTVRASAWESGADRRWQVLTAADPSPEPWGAMRLPPPAAGPVEVEAPGYLVLADNRDDGACCDSRALGWIPAEAIRGRVLVRLAGDPAQLPPEASARRGVQWRP